MVDHPDDGEWVRKAQARDRAAFAVLVDRYWDRLRRWLFGLTGHEHLAEDLTQEAFVRAWEALPRLRAEDTFRVWLFCIARNCLLDSGKGPRGTKPGRLPDSVAGRGPDPLNELLEQEARQQLQAALARVPDLYREAYLLWAQEDLSHGEIARVLAITEETARWRVFKARQFLVQELASYLDITKP